MMDLWNTLISNYNFVFKELNDERTRDYWPGFGSHAIILLVYLYFCLKAGPRWMKDKNPYDLKTTIFYYNIFQIIMSTYLFCASFSIWWVHYDWTCQPVLDKNSPSSQRMVALVWNYAILKLLELMDTVLFVLRKKDRQISALHLYHHTMMPIAGWIALKYYPTGHSTLVGVINSFVHMVMYTYYLIAGLGPEYQKYVWWKKHVTTLQLVQFLIIFIHNVYPSFTECSYPKWINVALSIGSLHFVYMFGNFYYVNYIKTPKEHSMKIK